eukprot:Skav206430  [mRNA]  locus=scaffold292:700504:703898:- [translate_table: standard]
MKGQGGWFGPHGSYGDYGDHSYDGGGYGGQQPHYGGKGGKSDGKGKANVANSYAYYDDSANWYGGKAGGSGGRSGWGYDWEQDAGIDDSFAKGALDEDEKMRAELAADMERIEQEQPIRDDESEGSDALPPPATESEIAEAQEIVRRAQDDLIERNKMKAKVKEPWETELGRWLV